LCDAENVNLKCFDKRTGELLWNRLESNPFLDEVGDVWTEVTVAKWARSLAYNITESMTSSVTVAGHEDAPSYKPAWNEPAGWQPSVDKIIRKISGATGAVIAEYPKGPVTWASGFGDNPGEFVNDGRVVTPLSRTVPFKVFTLSSEGDDTRLGYVIGPVAGSFVDTITFAVSSDGEALPATPPSPAVISPADLAADIRVSLLANFGDAVTDVTVTGGTVQGSEIEIVITWAHRDYHIGGITITRDFPDPPVPPPAFHLRGGQIGMYPFANPAGFTWGQKGWKEKIPVHGSFPDYEWHFGAGDTIQWCDNGSVTSVDARSPVGGVLRNYAMLNFDVSSSPWALNWIRGTVAEDSYLPSDEWSGGTSMYSRRLVFDDGQSSNGLRIQDFVTRGGWSRVYYNKVADTSYTHDVNGGVSMTQVSDNGSEYYLYTGPGKPDGRHITSDQYAGVMQHFKRNNNLTSKNILDNDGEQEERSRGGYAVGESYPVNYNAMRPAENTSLILDGQDRGTVPVATIPRDEPLNQLPVRGLSTSMRVACGFDASAVYVAGEADKNPLYDVSRNLVSEPIVAGSYLHGTYSAPHDAGYIDRLYAGRGNLYESLFIFYPSSSENFGVTDCKWRVVFQSPLSSGESAVSEWFDFDATLSQVNASLLSSFGTVATGQLREVEAVKFFDNTIFPLDSPAYQAPTDDYMLWQFGVTVEVNVNRGATGPYYFLLAHPYDWVPPWTYNLPVEWGPLDDPGPTLPSAAGAPGYPMSMNIQLKDVVRSPIKEIGSMDWTGQTVHWTRNWSGNNTGVTSAWVHDTRMIVSGSEVRAEIATT
tara:strand:- start:1622 stop:4075 length:2454 start_codon:yes stop_codon:yes gene_type:complete